MLADGEGPDLEEGEPYLKPVKVKQTVLDEDDSPTTGRRFTRA